MRAVIQPGNACGCIPAPPSKSMAHRLLICAALARGQSTIRSVDRSEDILATIDALEALGARFAWRGNDVSVFGCDPAQAAPALLPCRESGSTLRFLIPLCLLSASVHRLTGSQTLLSRPLSVYEDICRAQGLRLEKKSAELLVQGPLSPGDYAVPGGVSSQFISGLLFALPLLPAASTVRLIPPVESRPYVRMTVQALRAFQVNVTEESENIFLLPGGAQYRPRQADVEGDWSNAAFLLALNALGDPVQVSGLNENSLQGDRVCREAFSRLANGPARVDVADCPDLAPVLFAVAAACHGGTLTGTRRLRYKESDRGQAMAEELRKLGVQVDVAENEITVHPGALHAPSQPLSSHNDHRVAMALSLLCTRTGGEIQDAQAVRKSWPAYWDALRRLGIRVSLA